MVRLAEATAGTPIHLTVATLRARPDSVLEAALAAMGTPLVSFAITSPETAGALPAPRELLRLLRFVRRERFDLINTHLNTSDVVGVLAGFTSGTPVVSTQHSVRRTAPNPIRERVRRFALRHGTVEVIAVGDAVAAVQRAELGSRRVTVVPNPAPPPWVPDPSARARVRAEVGLSNDQPVLLAAGRLEPPKDHLMLIEAMRTVLDQRPEAALLIAGTGTWAGRLEQRVEALGCGASVRLLGHRDDIDALYAAADVFVSSSAWEGMPLSILEAMAAGLPVVATDVGDCADVIGAAGMLVPPGDPAALARALVESLDPVTRSTRSGASRDRAHLEFGVDAWVRRVARVYDRAVRGTTP